MAKTAKDLCNREPPSVILFREFPGSGRTEMNTNSIALNTVVVLKLRRPVYRQNPMIQDFSAKLTAADDVQLGRD